MHVQACPVHLLTELLILSVETLAVLLTLLIHSTACTAVATLAMMSSRHQHRHRRHLSMTENWNLFFVCTPSEVQLLTVGIFHR